MADTQVLIESLKVLKVPYDLKFYNLPLSHYTHLAEDIGFSKVVRYLRDVLIHYKDDPIVSEKARIAIRKLKSSFLTEEEMEDSDPECECGCLILEDYPECPVCGKKLYDEEGCYYRLEDGGCAIDGAECHRKDHTNCKKLNVE